MRACAQLALCGQAPETALATALASVNFYVGQLELEAQLGEAQAQRRMGKVQEACKKKLQEVHNGYMQARAGGPSVLSCRTLACKEDYGRAHDCVVCRPSASTMRSARRSRPWRPTRPSCRASTRRSHRPAAT